MLKDKGQRINALAKSANFEDQGKILLYNYA